MGLFYLFVTADMIKEWYKKSHLYTASIKRKNLYGHISGDPLSDHGGRRPEIERVNETFFLNLQ